MICGKIEKTEINFPVNLIQHWGVNWHLLKMELHSFYGNSSGIFTLEVNCFLTSAIEACFSWFNWCLFWYSRQ